MRIIPDPSVQRFILTPSSLTTTSNSAGNATGFLFGIGPYEGWSARISLATTCSSTGGIKYGFTVPSGATFSAKFFGCTSALTSPAFEVLTAAGLGRVWNGAAINGEVQIQIAVTNAGTSGNVQLQFASGQNLQTSTIYFNSDMRAERVS